MKADHEAALHFVNKVWRAQEHSEGYVFLSFKDAHGGWHDVPLEWDGDSVSLEKLPNRGRDVYFCPNVFTRPKRQEKHALPSVWLHADLDEVRPDDVELNPTTAWETSRRRYQCLWRVAENHLDPKQHRAINQRLTYLTGADKGGWSITKVLRVPGSVSKKYGDPQAVRLLWEDLQHYLPKVLIRKVKRVQVTKQVSVRDLKLPDMTASAVLHKHKSSLPKRALQLIKAKSAQVGERSERLWELECLCVQAGVPPEETLILVRETVWNKYAGQRRELPQLWAEIEKAVAHVEADADEEKTLPSKDLKLTTYSKFLATPLPMEKWTVDTIWSNDAHGLIAGEPKTFKSFIATDLAVSVASGTPFLGFFEVPQTGPVILIQEENTPAMMKDRLEKIACSRQLGGKIKTSGRTLEMISPEDLPIHLMNNQGFNLTDDSHLEFLEDQIRVVKPKLVVLDPIYLMMPGVDENSAVGLTPVLRKLLLLKQRNNCGMLIVHHYNKPRHEEDRHPGNRISGSGVFYRWFESALYVERGAEPGSVKMTPEHRGAAPAGAIHVDFDIGDMGEPIYHADVEIRKSENRSSRRQLREIVEADPGVTVSKAAEELGISGSRVKVLAERLGMHVRAGKADGSRGRPSSRLYLK